MKENMTFRRPFSSEERVLPASLDRQVSIVHYSSNLRELREHTGYIMSKRMQILIQENCTRKTKR